MKPNPEDAPAGFSVRQQLDGDGTLVIRLAGAITVQDGKVPFVTVHDILTNSSFRRVRLDMSSVRHMDSCGIALIASVSRVCRSKDTPFELAGDDTKMHGLVTMLDLEAVGERPQVSTSPDRAGLVISIGESVLSILRNMRFIISFVGEILLAMIWALRNPGRLRMGDVLTAIQRNGVDAIPIILLVNFLVGIVLAFQAAIQLRQFGANIYVANLVGLAQTREFGPMITAIILAGRSGSAFAAEIGSMKVNEEVDALTTMGLDPVRFLVVPKTLSLLVALPVLALYADLMGILGGLIVGITGLDLTLQGYLLQTQKALHLFDVFSGVIKTFAFALIVSGIGCLRGFQVRGGADSVGHAATSAVVSGIFLIILADAIFTVIFQYV